MKKNRNTPNWKKGDMVRLNKAVADFNKKISELEKIEGNTYLPEKIESKEIKKNIKTKNELTRYIKELRRFSEKGSEQLYTTESGEKLTVWEREKLQRQANIRKKYLTKELEPFKVKDEFGHTKLQMGNSEARSIMGNLKRLENLETAIGDEFKRLKRYINYTGTLDWELRKAMVYKENYLGVLKRYEKLDGYKQLLAKIRNLDSISFFKLIEKTGDINKIDIQYQSDVTLTQEDFYKYLEDIGIVIENKKVQKGGN